MKTNFRLYYEKDQKFYMKMIREEDPAPETFEFKLRLFKVEGYVPGEGESLVVFGSPD